MATAEYIVGRKTYRRPQAVCFAESEPFEVDDATYGKMYVPDGTEFRDFLILSDHNRKGIDMGVKRIGKQERTINGRMRSYWVADKLTISLSWDMLPSRGWVTGKPIGSDGKSTLPPDAYRDKLTADGGAGGNELLEWYKGHTGSFWVLLAYDRYPLMDVGDGPFEQLHRYNEKVEMFLTDECSYSVERRGATNTDFWNMSLKLEEA